MNKGTHKCEKCEEDFDWCGIVKKNSKYGTIGAGICEGDMNADIEQIAINKFRVTVACPKCRHINVIEIES